MESTSAAREIARLEKEVTDLRDSLIEAHEENQSIRHQVRSTIEICDEAIKDLKASDRRTSMLMLVMMAVVFGIGVGSVSATTIPRRDINDVVNFETMTLLDPCHEKQEVGSRHYGLCVGTCPRTNTTGHHEHREHPAIP